MLLSRRKCSQKTTEDLSLVIGMVNFLSPSVVCQKQQAQAESWSPDAIIWDQIEREFEVSLNTFSAVLYLRRIVTGHILSLYMKHVVKLLGNGVVTLVAKSFLWNQLHTILSLSPQATFEKASFFSTQVLEIAWKFTWGSKKVSTKTKAIFHQISCASSGFVAIVSSFFLHFTDPRAHQTQASPLKTVRTCEPQFFHGNKRMRWRSWGLRKDCDSSIYRN